MKFIDSNVLIYVADDTDAGKQRVARSIVCDAISSNGLMVSAQVINEFCAVSLDMNDGQLYCGIKAVNPFKQ